MQITQVVSSSNDNTHTIVMSDYENEIFGRILTMIDVNAWEESAAQDISRVVEEHDVISILRAYSTGLDIVRRLEQPL